MTSTIPYRPEIFSGLIFTTAQVVFMTAKFTSLSSVHINDFHTFTVKKMSSKVRSKEEVEK